MSDKGISSILAKVSLAVVAIGLLLALLATAALAHPPAQDPRDPFETPDSREGGKFGEENGNGGERRAAAPLTCGHVSGKVINWGYRPEPEIPVVLKSGSWEASSITVENGSYAFGNLGVGIAKINTRLAPLDPLKPLAPDAAVYLTCDFPTVAILGLYTGSSVEPPVTFEMSSPSQMVNAGQQTLITLSIENNLPTAISNVIVTDLLPFGLKALDVSTSVDTPPENLRIVNGGDDGRLVVAYLDTIAAEAKETILLTVTLIEDTPPETAIKNTATLFYRESVAVQASLDFTIGSSSRVIPAAAKVGPSSAVSLEEAMAMDEPDVKTASTAQDETRPVAGPASAADSQETAAERPGGDAVEEDTAAEDGADPMEELLPQTGNKSLAENNLGRNPGWVGPTIGLGLILLAFAAYAFQSTYWRREF